MLAGLFDEEGPEFESGGNASEEPHTCSVPRPPCPRNATGLCGLGNLGATCYLSALLQTLHFTPELRDALFRLGPEELGELSDDPSADNSMVRLIPIQLQRLFSRLLLVDQQSAGVDALTSSFGWQGNEELQQHDVQELNRILFTAIESSLAGTSGEHLIAQLYHGTSVSRVICQKCGRVSRREEEFLDLPVALSGGGSLENRLKESFVDMELLEGRNQYRCEECKTLVDAKKGTRLDKLPPILTFALLRFLYDFERGERYKDSSRLTFPHQLDMAPYCDGQGEGKGEGQGEGEGESLVYELYSVVVHSGSTHSGHYTALIRDVDNLGNWTHPEEEPVQLPADPESGRDEFISFDSPIGLLKELLTQQGGSTTMDKLSKSLQQQTGVTWNNRYKKQHGTLGKFLKKHSDIFEVSDSYHISLKTEAPKQEGVGLTEKMQVTGEVIAMATGETGGSPTEGDDGLSHQSGDGGGSHNLVVKGEEHEGPTPKMAEAEVHQEVVAMDHTHKREKEVEKGGKVPLPKAIPPIGQQWFEYNDTSVRPVDSKEIDRMFQGKKSAYMLFYRRKTLDRPAEAIGNPSHGVPPQLLAAAQKENTRLEEERERYDIAFNTITICAHFSEEYEVKDGALQRSSVDGLDLTVVEIDRRKTLSELKRSIQEMYPGHVLPEESHTLSLAKHLPAGLHIYQELKDDADSLNLTTLGLRNGCNVFVWDGAQVGGVKPCSGPNSEPILLNIYYPSQDGQDHREMSKGFPRNLTLQDLKAMLSSEVGIPPGNMSVSLINEGVQKHQAVSLLGSNKNLFTLTELNLRDGDRLAVEKQAKKGTKMLAHTVADWQNRTIHIIVEDRCSPLPTSADPWPIITVEAEKDQTLSHLKDVILKRIDVHTAAIDGGGRLRIDDEFQGLGPPLHEDHTLATVGVVQGSKLVLETGAPPTSSEISLQFQEYPPKPQDKLTELIVDKKTTIRQCLDQLIIALGFQSDEFHLRRSNWCGEATDVIEDEEGTVEELRLQPGDLLFIEEGKLPPKGFVRLPVFLYNPEEEGMEGAGHSLSGNVDHAVHEKIEEADTESILQGLPLHEHDPAQYYPPVFGALRHIGTVEVSKEATVEALKEMVLTLPAMNEFVVPSTSFLRIRELANKRPGRVLKAPAQTLRRHKITSSSQVCCTCLHREENLGASSFVLNVHLRVEEQRTYGPPMEVVFDAHPSPTPAALRTRISHLLGIPPEQLLVAKYKFESFEWIRINEPSTGEEGGAVSGKGTKKGKKGSKVVSLKNAPFLLKDGDIIGVKDVFPDAENKYDFSIIEDDKGRAILQAVIEEKRRRRKGKGSDSWSESQGGKTGRRRPEVGIKIYVPNFKK